MNTNELMIGDWVYNKHHKKNIQITPYDFFIHGHLPSGRQYFIDKPELVSGRDLEPILLTPEILEKNGWYHAKFDGSYGRKAMRIDGYYRDELPKGVDNALSFAQWSIDEKFMYHMLEIYMWVGSIHLEIEYVHELQHALRLCGIEKEIVI